MKLNSESIALLLKWGKLNSLNSMYVRTSTGIALSTPARTFKKQVSRQVKLQLPKELPFNPTDKFELTLHFYLNTRFFVRDVSNFVKLVEDTIFDTLDINDARNIKLKLSKSHNKNLSQEYISVIVRKMSDLEYKNWELITKVKEVSSGILKVPKKLLRALGMDRRKKFSYDEVLSLLANQYIMISENSLDKDLSENIVANRGINELPKSIKNKKNK